MPVQRILAETIHTALPWTVVSRGGGMRELVSGAKDIATFWPRNGDEASREVNEANVRLAARAVNCHAELLQLVREARELLGDPDTRIDLRDWLRAADAVIVKAQS